MIKDTLSLLTLLIAFTTTQMAFAYGSGSNAAVADAERRKVAFAAVVAGLVGQKVYGSSVIDLNVIKAWAYDTTINGKTDSNSILLSVGLDYFNNATFTSSVDSANKLAGNFELVGFDWSITESSANQYKFSYPLGSSDISVNINHGKISAICSISLGFDWDIDGTYSSDGQVQMTLHSHNLVSDIEVVGQIRPE